MPVSHPRPTAGRPDTRAANLVAHPPARRLSDVAKLPEVFGISARVDSASYVDRGGLDDLFQRTLEAHKHIAVHGGSKQGKSWLRARGLRESDTLLVQCTPSSTAASLLSEALGRLNVSATLKMTTSRDISGSLDFSGAAELGKIVAKAKVSGSVQGAASRTTTEETAPVGQTSADLLWVSLTLVESGKRLVLEDFHYLTESMQREFAFLLKAMGEYGLYVVIVGVWPRDHLLTYFNGDLESVYKTFTCDGMTASFAKSSSRARTPSMS